jgi:hypothetical protein
MNLQCIRDRESLKPFGLSFPSLDWERRRFHPLPTGQEPEGLGWRDPARRPERRLARQSASMVLVPLLGSAGIIAYAETGQGRPNPRESMLVKKGCATALATSLFSIAEFSHEAGSPGIPFDHSSRQRAMGQHSMNRTSQG